MMLQSTLGQITVKSGQLLNANPIGFTGLLQNQILVMLHFKLKQWRQPQKCPQIFFFSLKHLKTLPMPVQCILHSQQFQFTAVAQSTAVLCVFYNTQDAVSLITRPH